MMNTGTQQETPVFTGAHDQSSTVQSASEPLVVPSGATRNQWRLALLVSQLEATSADHVKQAILSGLEYAQESAEKEDREQRGYGGQYTALNDLICHMLGYTRNPL